MTARFVAAVAGTGARILDTRKTTPGLRALEKAAVAAGGGRNHRIGLYDAILIKENHIALAGSVAKAIHGARRAHPDLAVEVEVRNLDETAYALGTGADLLLLDNMDTETLRAAVGLRDENSPTGQAPVAGGLRRRQPRDGPGDRRDRRRLHLDRRPHPLSPLPRLQPAARTQLRSDRNGPVGRGEGGLDGHSPLLSAGPSSTSHLSNFESRRSLSTRPPVCSLGQ